MSWSFSGKGQAKSLKAMVAGYKNPYDVGSPDAGIAMEGRHIEAAKAIVQEALDKVGAMYPGGILDVQASGSEWIGGVDLKVSVTTMGSLLMDPPEPTPGPEPADASAGGNA